MINQSTDTISSVMNLSLRMLTVFLFAAFLLNVSNYWFIRIYSTPHQSIPQIRVYPKTASGTEVTRTSVSRAVSYWSMALHCKNGSYVPDEDNPSALSSVSRRTKNTSEAAINTFSAYSLIFVKTKSPEKNMENCPELPPGLGPELEDRAMIIKHFHNFEAKYNEVKPGGIYQPTFCKSLQTVAIVIAYRGCKTYLATFMNVLHAFLIKQQLDYQVFVVEQSNTSQPYNRGKLLNVGFSEAMRFRNSEWQCIVIHEPHIVPVDSRNLYRCSWYPKQLASTIEKHIKLFRASTTPFLGGAFAITPDQFVKVNGFSNSYWGNNADVYDFYQRLNLTKSFVENSHPLIGKYKLLRKGLDLWPQSEFLTTPSPMFLLDGLTSLKYTVDNFELTPLYTYIQVNIDKDIEQKSRAKLLHKLLNPDIYETTKKLIQQYNNKYL